MANGYFERGEIYNIRMDNGLGSEEGSFRPGVIVSSSDGNKTSSTLLVAYLTTQYRNLSITMETYATGRRSYILGSQIATVDKSRLRATPMGTLSNSEMNRLDEILEEVFDLGYVDDAALAEKDKEIEKLKAEIAELTGEVAKWQGEIIKKKAAHEDELLSYKVENAMWQKCYERSLDQLVKMKVTADVTVRANGVVGQKPVETPKIVEPVEKIVENTEPTAEAVEELLDINSASATALKKVGFSVALAKAVVKARPFNTVEDLKKVPGMAKTKYQILAPKLCCVPVVVEEPVVEEPKVTVAPEQPKKQEKDPGFEKVNVNTASAKELHDALGISMTTCYSISGYRKKNGPYKKLEDLLPVANVTPTLLNRLGHLMEV